MIAVGTTDSTNAIATAGALQEVGGGMGMKEGFVVKLDVDGKRLWGTYVVSNGTDSVTDVATGAHRWQHVVDQQRRPLRHPPTHAGRAESAAHTAEGYAQLLAALATRRLLEALLEVPAHAEGQPAGQPLLSTTTAWRCHAASGA